MTPENAFLSPNIWKYDSPLPPAPQLCNKDVDRLLTNMLPFCFQTYKMLGEKKSSLVERPLYIFHTIAGGF